MTGKSDRRFVFLFFVALLLFSSSFAWAEGASLIWENIPHNVSRGQFITSIAEKTHVSPTALMVLNGLKGSALKPDMTLLIPQIKLMAVAASSLSGKAMGNRGNFSVKAYQIYSANKKCYAMVYAVGKTTRSDEQFLSVFILEKNVWMEMDRIDFVHPIRWSLTQQIKLLSPDAAGNEGCSFHLEFIWDSKDYGWDGIIHVPSVSQYLHGARLVKHVVSDGAQLTEDLPPFYFDRENIGRPWPERLLYLKSNILQHQARLMEVDLVR